MNALERIRLSLCLAALFILPGCASQLSAPQRTQLQAGEEAYRRKDYPGAIQSLSQFLGTAKDQPEVPRALYLRGSSYAMAGRRPDAFNDLHRCIDTPGDPEAIWRAYVVLGTLHFEDGNWDAAVRALNAAEKRIPDDPMKQFLQHPVQDGSDSPKAAVLFREGVCYERLGRWNDSRRPFEELVRSYPKSAYAAQAERRLLLGARFYAIQCGVFGEERNAQAQVARLAQQRFNASIKRETRNRRPSFVVLVGQYPTYDQAMRELARVKSVVPDAVLWP